MLAAYSNQTGTNWDSYTQLVCFAYNTSIQASIRQNPFFVLHFRDAQLPSDLALTVPEPNPLDFSFSTFVQESAKGIRESWALVEKAILAAQNTQKEFSDEFRRKKPHEIEIQDLVLLFKDAIPQGHKFSRPWVGPYRVIGVKRPNVTVKTMGTEKEKLLTVHMDKVKHFINDSTLPLRGEERSFQEYHEKVPEPIPEIRESIPELPTEEIIAPSEQPLLRRSTRQRKPNPRYADYITH
ncbi:retrovirus-related Pol polyprotein from transposon [Ditylenchus destructor]|uniref:Retrovirus-related Pol polyprotein from transposon n=1 Tax=Ditylenchus destructor TaxID=166010 RepID=A0AAD4MNQ2_9BILA|nr:retrovirus-related Pol polyprotein from transposon [Ditylenchus destructor]